MIVIDANEKVNMAVYERLLDNDVIPWILKTYPGGNLVFQQDGAPVHTASSIQQKLTEKLGGEAHFWRKETWPLQSPHLNPLDYSIWSVLQDDMAYMSHVESKALASMATRPFTIAYTIHDTPVLNSPNCSSSVQVPSSLPYLSCQFLVKSYPNIAQYDTKLLYIFPVVLVSRCLQD